MKKAPALPLFGDAYLADTRHLSLEEHGAYLQLLLIAWRSPDCALPNDDNRLARMLGITANRWAKLKSTVMAFWTLEDAGWQQKRLLKERQYVFKKSEQNADAANARWTAKPLKNNDEDHANASPMQSERNAPSPTPKREEEKVMPDTSGAFAFLGRVIKLAPRHLNEWQRTYHSIPDVVAELSTLDEWWQTQPEQKRSNWFLATKGMLNKKHQANVAAERQAKAMPVWNGYA